jgi:hypothetical protein
MLSARGNKVNERQIVDFSWDGATSKQYQGLYNGALIVRVPNNGFYTGHIGAVKPPVATITPQ